MPIIRRQLKPSDVYPDDLRYDSETDTVQSLINGTWTDNPHADPRTQTTFPPRITSDPSCDAAESIMAAFKGQIDGVLTAIDGSQTAFTIAGIILSLFAFGPFGVFISLALLLAHAMLDAGTTAISEALTTENYHKFVCILKCHMDGATGRLTPGSLADINTDIDSKIGGLGAVILKAMTSLAGEGGMNNLASLGTSTGDCTDCHCTDCDLSFWEVLTNGIEITRDEVSITVQASHVGSVYIIDMTNHLAGWSASGNYSDNCCSWNFEAIVGTQTSQAYVPCGGNYSSNLNSISGLPVPSCNLMELQGSAPFTIVFTVA